jgi:predicted nucleic acid-binding protein
MIISNSTPLIAFARINQISLLRKVTNKLVIPQAVADEISEYTTNIHRGIIDLKQESWISVHSVRSEATVKLLLPTLDRGEAEVITLGLEKQAKLILIDELTGRKVAESLNLNIIGTVGILIRAKEKGDISAVRPFIEEMIRKGIRYNQRFIESILQKIGE